jgi:hypothetical protein
MGRLGPYTGPDLPRRPRIRDLYGYQALASTESLLLLCLGNSLKFVSFRGWASTLRRKRKNPRKLHKQLTSVLPLHYAPASRGGRSRTSTSRL